MTGPIARRVLVTALLTFACATRTGLPFCSSDTASLVAPTAACRAEPEYAAFVSRLTEWIEPLGGPLRYQVVIGGRGRVHSVCAERGVGVDQWAARANVAESLAVVEDLGTGPACMAGTRLHLNRAGALHAEVETIRSDCRREARARLHLDEASGMTPAGVSVAHAGSEFRRCLERAQQRRGELWVYLEQRPDPLVFDQTPESAPRRTAILACANHGRRNDAATADGMIAYALRAEAAQDCLLGHGWVRPSFEPWRERAQRAGPRPFWAGATQPAWSCTSSAACSEPESWLWREKAREGTRRHEKAREDRSSSRGARGRCLRFRAQMTPSVSSPRLRVLG